MQAPEEPSPARTGKLSRSDAQNLLVNKAVLGGAVQARQRRLTMDTGTASQLFEKYLTMPVQRY